MAERCDFGDELLHDLKTKLRVLHLTSAKAQRDFDLHVLAQEINGMTNLDAKIVRVNPRAQLHFLYGGSVLMLLGLLILLGLFVAELSEVHDATYGRNGRRGDFHKVNPVLAREIQRIVQGHYPELLAVDADYTDFTGTDFTVDPNKRRRRGITWGERATQGTLVGCDIIIVSSFKLAGFTGQTIDCLFTIRSGRRKPKVDSQFPL